jgi:hypothetical protein
MSETLNFKKKENEFEVSSFDSDKEIEFSILRYNHMVGSMFLNPNEINELITHLTKCLRSINEPIEVLGENTK